MFPRNLHPQSYILVAFYVAQNREKIAEYSSGYKDSLMLQIPKAAGVILCCYVNKTQ